MTATLDLVLVGFPDLMAPGRARRRHGAVQPHIPAGDLITAVQARQLCLHRYPEAVQRAYFRAARTGSLTLAAADHLAVALLGEHPATIWGDEWWEATAS